jgi:cytidylate kinase
MSSYYPEEIGIHLKKESITEQQLQQLIQNFPSNVILRVFGFAGTGKGSLSAQLSNTLFIPNVESSLIWRGITWVYEDLGLELNIENSDIVLSKIEVVSGDKKDIRIRYKNELLERSVLKSALVDSKVSKYAADSYLRDKFYILLADFLKNLNASCVLDGRGAYPPYIIEAEKSGIKVIRLLLDASEEEMSHRYYAAYVAKQKSKNPDYVETEEEKQKMMLDFKQGISARNQQDWETWHKLNLGIITPETAVIDTTGLSIDEVTMTALSFVNRELGM